MEEVTTDTTRITLCGRLTLEWDGERLETKLPGRQGRLIFAYLTLNRERPVRRDELVEALWADEGLPRGGEGLLAPPLSRLRKALGPGRIEGRSELELVLGESPWVDWEVARAQIESARAALASGDDESAWDEAVAAEQILGGGLLPGLEAGWIDEYRNQLDDLRLQALELAARAGASIGGPRLARAERAARTAVELSRFRESARVALLEVMEAQGNVAEALRAYDEFRVLLREELGTFPAPELTSIHERLLNAHERDAAPSDPAANGRAPVPAPPSRPTATPADIGRQIDPRIETIGLVGRETVLEHLGQELDRAAAGELRIALLAGEGGLGKTRIAAELAASRDDITVLYGRSGQDEVRPLRIWIDLLRSALRQAEGIDLAGIIGADGPTLARILPELVKHLDLPAPGAPADLESERRALFDAVMRMIGRISAVKPMLIVLDDLHWADRSTLMLLTSLAGDDPPGGLLALGLYRDNELAADSLLPETLVNLQRRLPTTRLELEPLDAEEISRLIEGRMDPALAGSLRDQTGGNPFLIEQLVRHMEEIGSDDIEGVPAEIRELVTQRVSRLSDGGDELLRRASLIGQDFDLAILERTTPLDEDRVIDLLDEAVDAGLLDESMTVPGRYSFVHALLRGALSDQVSLTRRTTVHRDIGEAIEYQARGRTAKHLGELARHFGLAGPEETDRAIQYAILAAEQAEERLAYDEAVDFHESAIRACRADEPVDQGLLARLLLNRAEAQWMNGMLQAAGDSFFEAAAAARESGRPDLLARAALGTGWGNWDAFDTDLTTRIGLLEEARDALGEEPSTLKARVVSALAQALYYGSGKAREARILAAEAERMIAGTDDPEAEYAVVADVAFTRWEPDSRDLRLPASERLVELGSRLPERELLAQALGWRSLSMLNLGRRAEAAADRARHAEMSLTLPQIRVTTEAMRAVDCFLSGHWQEGERIAGRLFDAGLPRPARLILEDALRFMVRAEQGRLGEHLDRLELLARGASGWETWPTWRLGLLLARAQAGQADQVREELGRLPMDGLDNLSEYNATFLPFCAIGNLLAGEIGDRRGAAKLLELMEPYRGEWVMIGRVGSTLGPVDLHVGELQLMVGNDREAATSLERALVTCVEMESMQFTARARLGLAEALTRLGHPEGPERTVELHEAGKNTALELGMIPALRRHTR